MTLGRIFGLTLLFLFFETVVGVLTAVFLPDFNVFLACAVITAIALAVWVVVILVMRYASRPHASESAPPPPPPTAPEAAVADSGFVTELKALLTEANERLAGLPDDPKRRAKPLVSTLPLYIITGPPGAGKTSSIANSGLEPRLLSGKVLLDSGTVPTRICNLWYVSGAVFADVSGSLFLNDPTDWESLLRALCGRPRTSLWRSLFTFGRQQHNLRGVMLVADAKPLLRDSGSQQLSPEWRKVQDRLHTLGNVIGSNFPVYVLFTKADSVPYFADFFARLSDTEDRRALGATLPLLSTAEQQTRQVYAEAESKRLASYFNRLCASVAAKRVTMLAREETSGKKAFIYEFPRELKRIRTEVVQLLVDLFSPNPLQPGPRLRGFYFSGIRQVTRAQSIDDVPGDSSVVRTGSDATVFFGARRSFSFADTGAGSASPGRVPRWAFLSDVFAQVFLADHFRSTGSVLDRRIQLYRNVLLGTATAILLLLCLAWTSSWSQNRALLKEANDAVAGLQATTATPPSIESLRALEVVHEELEKLQTFEREHTPLGMRWGLYSGNRAIPPLREVYFDRFRRVFLDPMLGKMTGQFSHLQSTAANAPFDEVYTRLKSYRMVSSRGCTPEKPMLDHVLPAVWPWNAALSPEAAKLATKQIDFYTTELLRSDPYEKQIGENGSAVEQARKYLIESKGPERLLRGLIERVNSEQPPDSLGKYASNYAEVLKGQDKVEAAYTLAGYNLISKRIRDRDFLSVGEPCVVGLNAAATNWKPGNADQALLEDLYAKEYLQRWKQFLTSQQVIGYADPQDAARRLHILADTRSPILALMFMVSVNTFLPVERSQTEEVAKELGKQSLNRGLSRYLPSVQREREEVNRAMHTTPPQPHTTAADIVQAFQPSRVAADPKIPNNYLNPANRPYVNSLAELGDALGPLASRASTPTDTSAWDQANRAETKAWSDVRQLEQGFERTPQNIDIDVKGIVEAPIKNVHAMIPSNPAQLVASPLNGAAAKLCAQFNRLRTKYPFNPSASQEVSIEELTRYFAPGTGELAAFVQQPPLGAMLQRSGKLWIQNPAVPQPHLSQQFLSALTAQTQFSEALFPEGSTQPHLEYTISLSSPQSISFNIEIDGKTVKSVDPTPTLLQKYVWPNPSGTQGASLNITSGVVVPLRGRGLWGIFRLLGRATEHQGSVAVFSRLGLEGDSEQLQDSSGRPASLRVQAETRNGVPLFDKNYFSRIPCVGKAVQ